MDDYLENGKNTCDAKWTMSIAVGNKSFVERVKVLMGVFARGRKSMEVGIHINFENLLLPIEPFSGVKRTI